VAFGLYGMQFEKVVGIRMSKSPSTGSKGPQDLCRRGPDGMAPEGPIERINQADRLSAQRSPNGCRNLLFWGVTRTVS